MFETSFILLVKALLYNIMLPLVPGILFLRICFGKKFEGILLYLLGRFVGVGVVAFSLFNIQFFHFGLGIIEYFFVFGVLSLVFVGKLMYTKTALKKYIETLSIQNIFPQIQKSFISLSKIEKIITLVLSVFGVGFLILSFLHTSNFPTYADDSFGNRNGTAYNIYQDGGVHLFGDEKEILGRGRLGYPIYIPLYKAVISDFMGSFNDIYINMWQWLSFFGLLIFIFTITFTKTKNIFYSLLPIGLICSLPLVFFHSSEGYMELPCAVYSILTIWAFWKFLEENQYHYISLALLFGFILSHIKNDGLLGYFAGIGISFFIILLISKQFKNMLGGLWKDKTTLYSSIFYLLFFLLPFLIVRSINHLGFNPVSTTGGVGLAQVTHWEIFSVFPSIFMNMDNYNVVLIILLLLIISLRYQKRNFNKYFLLMSGGISLTIFVLVFLLTENYQRVMNQTTVNRVFTMCFFMILAFSGILFYKQKQGDD